MSFWYAHVIHSSSAHISDFKQGNAVFTVSFIPRLPAHYKILAEQCSLPCRVSPQR